MGVGVRFEPTPFPPMVPRMSTLKISLDADQDRFVEEQVRLGVYADAETAVRTTLDRLREDEALREERSRAKVQEGLDDLAAGRVVVIDDVAGWLEEISRRRPGGRSPRRDN